MTNGLGTGFAALSLLSILAMLALLDCLATVGVSLAVRRSDRFPTTMRYLLVAIGVAAIGVAGFGVLSRADEAPVLAWLFASIVLLPFLLVGASLYQTAGVAWIDLVAVTAMTWGFPFLVGAFVVFGTMNGIIAMFDLTPDAAWRMDIGWIAAALGGGATVLGMYLIRSRLSAVVRAATSLE